MRTICCKTHFRRRRSQRVMSKLCKMLVLMSSTDAKRVKLLAPYLRLYKQNPPA